MNRVPSPYRAPSPYGPQHGPQYIPHNGLPTGTAQVGPGAITYTTSTGSDGRTIYQPFKAVAASYQTPSGVVSGIQWIPGEPTTGRPSGSQYISSPGSSDAGGWRTYNGEDEKQRKREEKDAKRYHEQEGRKDPEYELRMARERDVQSNVNRERRKSISSGNVVPPGSVKFPVAGGASGYPTHSTIGMGYPSSPYSNVTHNVGAINPSPRVSATIPPGILKPSGSYDIASGRPRKYSTSDNGYDRTRTVSGNYANTNPYPSPPTTYASSSPYSNHKNQSPYANAYPTSQYISSPNTRPSDISAFGAANVTGYPGSSYVSSPARNPADLTARSTSPFGIPPSHLYPQGQSIPGSYSRSRANSRAGSPNPAAYIPGNASPNVGRSPHISVSTVPGESQQLPAPEAFSRPMNAANSFAPFDIVKIRDMDEIYDSKFLKMPIVLSTHDIYQEDWNRCMQDLGRSWTGQLPVSGVDKDGQPPRRSTLAADLVDLWNTSFFFPRGVELVLYKGRERRTGPQAGQIDILSGHDDSDISSTSNSSSDSESSYQEHRMTDPYGRPVVGQAELQEARRRRYEKSQEKRRRRKEKKARRKAKAREKTYSVGIACLPRGPPNVPYGSRPLSGNFGPTSVPYGTPVIPISRSHGYGGGY